MVERVGGGLSAFGVYTLAVSLAQRTQIFPQALTRSVYARLGTGSLDEAADLSARCFRQMLVLGVLLVIAGAMASPLIPLVYTAEFSGAVLPFIIFLVGRLFANCGWMLANFFTAHLGRPAIPMIATWGIVPMQGLGAWWAVGTGSLTLVAGAMAACNLVLMIAFIILFLRAQKSVGLGRLLIVGTEDLAPWRAIIARLFGRRSV
jgi:hypothetical protein